MANLCKLVDLGLSDYVQAYKVQLGYVEERKCAKIDKDVLIITEHRDVYTFGRKSKEKIPASITSLAFEVERGGEATFHNPGQLVCYPILLLRAEEQDVHLHLRRLEEMVIETLKRFGILGEQREGATGVWIKGKDKKIASVGVAVKSWVTYHGVALNVSNDLSGFAKINPCGFSSQVMTSISRELDQVGAVKMVEVKEKMVSCFGPLFHREII